MSAVWPVVPLGELLSKSEAWIDLAPDAEYQEVTVRLWGRGVTQRRLVTGAEIGSDRRLQVRPRQFILSRLDARNGAFGLVPQALDGAVVSNDFPTFDVHEHRMLPEYLGWLSRTASFVEACKTASEGTTNRVRLKEDSFLRLSVALPTVPEQRRIVGKIERLAGLVAEAKVLRRSAHEEQGILAGMRASQAFDSLPDVSWTPISDLGEGGTNPVQTGPFGAQLHASDFTDTGVPVLNVGNVWPEGLRLARDRSRATREGASTRALRTQARRPAFRQNRGDAREGMSCSRRLRRMANDRPSLSAAVGCRTLPACVCVRGASIRAKRKSPGVRRGPRSHQARVQHWPAVPSVIAFGIRARPDSSGRVPARAARRF